MQAIKNSRTFAKENNKNNLGDECIPVNGSKSNFNKKAFGAQNAHLNLSEVKDMMTLLLINIYINALLK